MAGIQERAGTGIIVDTNVIISALLPRSSRGVSSAELTHFREELISRIILHPLSEYRPFLKRAYEICRGFDEKDTPFVALALALSLPIVTNDGGILDNRGQYDALPIEDLLR
ncbi:PIN domain-containing protein [Thermococcus sp. JdF3]|uniref:PIN domain-containing protein n=1 Tax=Thermococcus sp. JdF3 TaxID=1638258 RepID=UPI00143A1C4C|nr:PIN domain-containing protein [Thermococcus sp. JdF3]NJE02494.1 nucleotide-binding protein [Thermococcus sp. JdF3]